MSERTPEDLDLALLDLRAAATAAVAGSARAAAILTSLGLSPLYAEDLSFVCQRASRTGTFDQVAQLLDDVGEVARYPSLASDRSQQLKPEPGVSGR